MNARRWISLVVLLLQAAGLGHLALERHLLAADGTFHDAHGLTPEQHRGDHVCSPEGEGLEATSSDCAVLATWAAAAMVAPGLPLTRPLAPPEPGPSAQPRAAFSVDVLSRAPKASPPLNG